MASPAVRQQGFALWSLLTFLLNAILFVLIGLQLPAILDGARGRVAGVPPRTARGDQRRGDRHPARVGDGRCRTSSARSTGARPARRGASGWRRGWSRRGRDARRGLARRRPRARRADDVPQRDLIIFLTFAVIFATLVLQGLTLPALIRALGIESDDARGARGAARAARRDAGGARADRGARRRGVDARRHDRADARRSTTTARRRLKARAGKIEDDGYEDRSQPTSASCARCSRPSARRSSRCATTADLQRRHAPHRARARPRGRAPRDLTPRPRALALSLDAWRRADYGRGRARGEQHERARDRGTGDGAAGGAGAVDVQADVVVVGGGGGGLPAALFSRWLGNERDPAREGAGARRHGREGGLLVLGAEQRADARARHRGPRGGLPALRRARVAAGALRPRQPDVRPQAWEHAAMPGDLRERVAGAGAARRAGRAALPPLSTRRPTTGPSCPRTTRRPGACSSPTEARESMSDGGRNAIRTMSAAAARTASTSASGHRVQRVVMDGGAVIGVEAADARRGHPPRRRAQGGDLRVWRLHPRRRAARELPRRARFGGCAALTNEGDFVRISGRVGAQLRNMATRGCARSRSRRAVARRPDTVGHVLRRRATRCSSSTSTAAASSTRSCRTTSSRRRSSAGTRRAASTRTSSWSRSGTSAARTPRASDEYGRLIVADRAPTTRTSSAATRSRSSPPAMRERLARTRASPAASRSPTASPRTCARRSSASTASRAPASTRTSAAASGRPAAVQRRRRRAAGRRRTRRCGRSRTSGPYYAALVTGGTLDTKGGPKTDTEGRVLDDLDAPIPGLYGVGNCVASVSARAVLGGRRDARADHRLRLPRRAGERPRGGAGTRGRGPAVGRVVAPVGRRPAARHYAPRRMSATSAVPRPATVDGRRIDAVEHPGDAARRPLVLLHEGLGSVGLWRDFPRCARPGHRPPRARLLALRPRPLASRRPRRGRRRSSTRRRSTSSPRSCRSSTRPARSSSATATARSIALIHAAYHPVTGLALIAPHVFVEDVTVEEIRGRASCSRTAACASGWPATTTTPTPPSTAGATSGSTPRSASGTSSPTPHGVTAPTLLIQGARRPLRDARPDRPHRGRASRARSSDSSSRTQATARTSRPRGGPPGVAAFSDRLP